MALTYGFYNSLKGDRKYDAMQFSEIIDTLIIDGIIPNKGQLFAVTTAKNGMQINIGTGFAWFFHSWTKNDSVMVLTVGESDITRPRIDAVVLEVDRTEPVRANSIKIVKGVPAVNPEKPALVTNDKVHQYPLAYITVPAAAEEIQAENIENMVGRSPTVFATGVLDTVPIDDLWSRWEGEWDTWFSEIKLQLSGNVAANLQRQIDELKESMIFDDGTDIKGAFVNLEKKVLSKVGDVKITVRNDLGRAWALANGAEITAADVLVNKDVLDKDGVAWVKKSELKNTSTRTYGIDESNHIYAEHVNNPSFGTFTIKYTTDFKKWTTMNVVSGLNDKAHIVKLLSYSVYLKKWVITSYHSDSSTLYFILFDLNGPSSNITVRTLANIGTAHYYIHMTRNGCFYYYNYDYNNYDYNSDPNTQKYSFDLINWTSQPVDKSGLASGYSRAVTTMEYVGGYYWRFVTYRGTVNGVSNVSMMYVYRSSSLSDMQSQVLAIEMNRSSYIAHAIANDIMYIEINNDLYIVRNASIEKFNISHSETGGYFGATAYKYDSISNRILTVNIGLSNVHTVSIYKHNINNNSKTLLATISVNTTLYPYPYNDFICVFNYLLWWNSGAVNNSRLISYYLPVISLDDAYCYIKVRDE